jgi:hypothetical protein
MQRNLQYLLILVALGLPGIAHTQEPIAVPLPNPAPTYNPIPTTPSPLSTAAVLPSGQMREAVEPPWQPCDYRSSWYTRVEYFHWNERANGADFVNEHGALTTLGYVHRFGRERVRAEVFGGSVDYRGGAQYDDGTNVPLKAITNYLGAKTELEVLAEPDSIPWLTFVGGVGSRFWFRDLADGWDDSGGYVQGYQETWWTLYPYIGIEKRRQPYDGWELYGSTRIGITAITYNHATFDDSIVYPRLGVTSLSEFGIRGSHFQLGSTCELFTWSASASARGSYQPASNMLLIGLKTGWMF